MADPRLLIFSLCVLFSLLGPRGVFAYDRGTHEGITKSIVGGYEKLHGDVFNSSEEQHIIVGSSGEDDDIRFLNHFYDPINYRGLTVFGVSLGQPSESWAYDTRGQASWKCLAYLPCSHDIGYNDKLFSSPTDYSWDRAIYEYVYGDKKRGLEAVGHALHLLEDATVPAHVRNDQHGHVGSVGDADPYETFTSQFSTANINVPDNLPNVPTYSSLNSYLDHVARFTNTHFVSKDTLFEDYPLPNLSSLEIRDNFVYDLDGYRVAVAEEKIDRFGKKTQIIKIDDKGNSVLKDNWNTLSKTAILNGIGVIDLFFKSVEQEKKTGALKAKNISAAEQNAKDLAKNGFKYVKGLYGSSLSQDDVEELLGDNARQAGAAALVVADSPSQSAKNIVSTKPTVPTGNQNNPPEQQSTPQVLGASISPQEQPVGQEPSPEDSIPPTEPQAIVSPPSISSSEVPSGGSPTKTMSDSSSTKLSLVVLSPGEDDLFATTSVTFVGTTSEVSVVTAAYGATLATTTADGSGNWAFSFSLAPGTTTVSFSAATSSEVSATSTRTVVVDTTPPGAPSISINECSASFVSGDCTVATTTITVVWGSVSDAVYYGILKNNVTLATTTATSTTSSIGNSATTTFSVVAYKSNGLAATSTERSVFVTARPLIINEIAWAGTNASAEDEVIELRNMTNSILDLSHFVITTPDGTRVIPLTGTIAATGDSSGHDFFLIERNAEATTAVSPNATTVNFSQLSDGGEQLLLQWGNGTATTTIDTTPPVGVCSGWCAGASLGSVGYSVQSGTTTAQLTMERKENSFDGSLASSWQTADGYTLGAFDRTSGVIYGTLGANNSKENPSVGWFCSPDTASVIRDAHYTPQSSSCTYLMRAISTQARRYGDLYRGDVASSTIVNGHSFGQVYIKENQSDLISSPQAGEHFFIAIYEARVGAAYTSYPTDDNTLFRNYFTTGANPPPHSNYFVIPWVYGP